MRTASGIWVQWSQLFGGIRKCSPFVQQISMTNTSVAPDRFLIKDAQDDIAAHRLKA